MIPIADFLSTLERAYNCGASQPFLTLLIAFLEEIDGYLDKRADKAQELERQVVAELEEFMEHMYTVDKRKK